MRALPLIAAAAWLAVAFFTTGTAAAQEQSGRESVQRDTQPRSGAPPAKRPPRMSNRCYTQAINCVQFEREPVGTECWCVTPFGPSFGRIR